MVALAKFLAATIRTSRDWSIGSKREGWGTARRVKLIALTDAGAAFRKQALQTIYEPPPWIAALKPAEQRRLTEILRRAKERKLEEQTVAVRARAR